MSRPLPAIVIDFDGTIVDHECPKIGKMKPGARTAIKRLYKHYRIIISSCRNNPDIFRDTNTLQEMKEWLDAACIPYDEIDSGFNGKPLAIAYIDDRGINYGGGDHEWPDIADCLCKPHQQQQP